MSLFVDEKEAFFLIPSKSLIESEKAFCTSCLEKQPLTSMFAINFGLKAAFRLSWSPLSFLVVCCRLPVNTQYVMWWYGGWQKVLAQTVSDRICAVTMGGDNLEGQQLKWHLSASALWGIVSVAIRLACESEIESESRLAYFLSEAGNQPRQKKDPCLPSVSHIIFYLVLSSFMFRVFPPLHNLLFFCLFFFLSGNTLLCERVFAYLASVNIHLLVCRVPTLDYFFLANIYFGSDNAYF